MSEEERIIDGKVWQTAGEKYVVAKHALDNKVKLCIHM